MMRLPGALGILKSIIYCHAGESKSHKTYTRADSFKRIRKEIEIQIRSTLDPESWILGLEGNREIYFRSDPIRPLRPRLKFIIVMYPGILIFYVCMPFMNIKYTYKVYNFYSFEIET